MSCSARTRPTNASANSRQTALISGMSNHANLACLRRRGLRSRSGLSLHDADDGQLARREVDTVRLVIEVDDLGTVIVE